MRWTWLAVSLIACSSTEMHIYNETGATVTVEAAKKSVTIKPEWSRGHLSGKFAAGTKIVAKNETRVIEEITIDAEHAKQNLVYNVKGAGEYYLVEYTNAYAVEGSQEKAPNSPLAIVASLQGHSLTAVPPGVLVEYTDALPSVIGKKQRVFRVESVPHSLAIHGVEDYLLKHFETDLKMRGHLYFK